MIFVEARTEDGAPWEFVVSCSSLVLSWSQMLASTFSNCLIIMLQLTVLSLLDALR